MQHHPLLKTTWAGGCPRLTCRCCNARMDTQHQAAPQTNEDLEVRKARLRQIIDEGRKDELSEEDYLFAVRNALILDGQAEA